MFGTKVYCALNTIQNWRCETKDDALRVLRHHSRQYDVYHEHWSRCDFTSTVHKCEKTRPFATDGHEELGRA